MVVKHETTKAAGQKVFAVSDWNADHTPETELGDGCVAKDHGAPATDMVVNVCYGTGEPPDAATTTEGALFVKYTA